MFKTSLVLSCVALTALGWQQTSPRSSLPLKEERMMLEYNVTLGEAVLRVEAESEEDLGRVQVSKANGDCLFVLEAPSGAVRGLSGFKIELQEGSLADILANYPEGLYSIRARTAGGKVALGSALLLLDLPPAPQLVYPFEGAVVPVSGLVVRWLADRQASGYRVEMEQGESDGLVIQLPPGKNSLQIPDGILARGAETKLEIAALSANGNRTVAEVSFTTR
ncbi:MAG: hypothetical protein EXS08_03955 [Planctomycetes bacterium]|nr:hypothetical protein [Planctomycetota bacterium]